MRHILMTNGHNTFFSQSRQGLLKALRTLVLQPKLADDSFTFFSTPNKNDTSSAVRLRSYTTLAPPLQLFTKKSRRRGL